jgi:transcriptional regulator with XRE-family HTH domain
LPASPYSSVQQARTILAARLVELQKDAGIRTARDMAGRLGWQESKVSRIVNAVTPPSEEDVTAWCTACDASHEAAGLIAALRLYASPGELIVIEAGCAGETFGARQAQVSSASGVAVRGMWTY